MKNLGPDEMLEIVDLTEWKTRKAILEEIKSQNKYLSDRTFRSNVEKYNERYGQIINGSKHKLYIAHGQQGYILTSDKKIIEESIADSRKRALNQLSKESRVAKAIGLDSNLRMDLENMELI